MVPPPGALAEAGSRIGGGVEDGVACEFRIFIVGVSWLGDLGDHDWPAPDANHQSGRSGLAPLSGVRFADGMGLAFVLLLWVVGGLILASVSAAVLGGAVALLTRGARAGRRRVILLAAVFPFACGGWAAVLFVVQAVVNEGVFQRDVGMGDTWHCPLPNGYQVLMIDVTDRGALYNPKTQRSGDGVGSQEDAVFGVRTLQVVGPLMFGAADSKAYLHASDAAEAIDSWFVLDARTGTRKEFSSVAALRAEAQRLGVALTLEPIATVYGRYRFTWFEAAVGCAFLLPVLLGFGLIARAVIRVRRSRSPV